jgi:hypothetical protein
MKYLRNFDLSRFLIVSFLVFAHSFASLAQNCDPDEIINLHGIYKGPGKGSVRDIPKEDLAKEQAITQKFTNMVKNNYQPKGMNIHYGAAYSQPELYQPNGVNTGNYYCANFFLMYFYCNHENKTEPIAETHSIIEFRVNEWNYPSSFFVNKDANEVDPKTDLFATMKNKPVWNDNGYWTLTDTVYSGRDMTHFHYIVTKNKELPFVYVTKMEYLQKLRIYYTKLLQRELNYWENSSDKETEYAKSRIESSKSFYGKSIQHIDEFLANSSEEVLNETATVTGGGPQSEFEGFSESKYRNWIIKPNPSYYNAKAPKSTPHFIDVLFEIYEPEKACLNAKKDILKIIDFKALQEIVDKGGL